MWPRGGALIQYESMEVSWAVHVLEHVEDDQEALAEMWRVLKPGGVLIATLPAYPWLWSSHDEILGHWRRYRRREVKAKLQEAGFRVELLTYAVSAVLPAILAVRLAERIRHKPTRPGQSGLIVLPPPLNRVLIGLLDLERRLIPRTGLPWGSSLVVVGRKVVSGDS